MNTNCDENSWFLQEYQFHQEVEHQKWLDTLPEKREALIEYSYVILLGNVPVEEYEWVFASYSNSDEQYERLIAVLDDWQAEDVLSEDVEFLFDVAVSALEGASLILFDTELKEIIAEGGFSVAKMVNEVLGE